MTKRSKRAPGAPKRTPDFQSEDAERGFWANHDLTAYFDWSKAVLASFPDLKPSTQTISIRLPASLLIELKILANEKDVPYQSLMKVYLADRIVEERNRRVPA